MQQEEVKPFSETLKILLKFSKEHNEPFTIDVLQDCLGNLYHPDMRLKDILIVLDGALNEALEIKEFEIPNRNYVYSNIIKAPFDGSNPLGIGLFGPGKDEKFTIEQFYNKIITEYMHIFMMSNVGWCREYIFGENNGI